LEYKGAGKLAPAPCSFTALGPVPPPQEDKINADNVIEALPTHCAILMPKLLYCMFPIAESTRLFVIQLK
jgi:hypothetical protein